MPENKGLCSLSSPWDQGHSWSSVLAIVTLPLQDPECWVWAFGEHAWGMWVSSLTISIPCPPLCSCLVSTKPLEQLCMWGCPCAGAGHLPLLLSPLIQPVLAPLAPALSRVGSSSGPDLACDLQWGAATVAQTSLGFNFISLWHKGEFLTPGDTFFPLIILC